jgi:demethylmenaquinone methyltransferase/2-methoxy-6-polyprenyl-1,4-benzoquinol methylase
MSSGLGEDWDKILEDLRVLAPIYEKGNRILSLGRAAGLRRSAVASGLPPFGAVLDAGSGPGSMSVEAIRQNPSLESVLLDPLTEMLASASMQPELKEALLVRGVFEFLPFRDKAFSGYLAGFTLRDARDRGEAIQEAGRVLAPSGAAVVLDLGRPDSAAKGALVAAYWRLLAPALLFVFMGEKGKPFRDIYLTVRKLPSNSQAVSVFSRTIADVKASKLMMDGVLSIVARSPAQAMDLGKVSATGLK